MQQIKTFFFLFLWASLHAIFSSALVPVHIETPGKSLFCKSARRRPPGHQYLSEWSWTINLVYTHISPHSNMVQAAGRPRVAVGYTSLEATPTPCADFE